MTGNCHGRSAIASTVASTARESLIKSLVASVHPCVPVVQGFRWYLIRVSVARNAPQALGGCCHTIVALPAILIRLWYPDDRECHGFLNRPALTCSHGMTSEGFCSCRAMR